MNITTWLYLTDLIVNLNNVLSLTIAIGILLFVVSGFVWMMTHVTDDENEFTNKIFKAICSKMWIVALALITSSFIPSKNTMYLMLSSSMLQQSNLPQKVIEALQLKLDDVIVDFKKNNHSS